ncbi:macro domain-containing protein [Paenibacillus athensensis]|uniref:Appr-1-p processing protein n=1 Tax=Paenibacillus athensensis TaxID=1967502 RepID=A0A4Y8PPP8_9BACL|nr:macro domain-containing protein [Paenibacillus athensensis]MCD1261501.1 macro domain-containing protein [Paenibacillus athensensis]
MLRAIAGDITRQNQARFICNAANGTGPMGAGVAGAIRRAGGRAIQAEAEACCAARDIRPGELYVTGAGTLPYERVLHLVTMKKPGGATSYAIVRACLQALVRYCEEMGIDALALPALGTGVGRLDPRKVAELFGEVLRPHPKIVFTVVDIDERFISHVLREAR